MNITTPLVSIIIPTYNRADLIGETLDSILAQTYKNWECIVVDDGSKDNTEKVMSQYMAKDSRFKYYHRPKDRLSGGNAARTYGFEVSKGEYVQWFDDDDIMLGGYLESKVEVLNPDLDIILSSGCFWDPNTDERSMTSLKVITDLYQDFLCWRLTVLTPGVFFKRSFLEDKELFADKIIRGQETEFLLRMFFKLSSSSYKLVNKPLFLYRKHAVTKTHKNHDYIPLFKNSEFIIYFENFVRLQESGNKEGLNFCYHRLLSLFYSSIHNHDLELAKKIVKMFFPLLKLKNYFQGIELIFLGKAFIRMNYCSYSFIQRWRNFEF